VLEIPSGKSLIYRRKRRGPRTKPSGTPEKTGQGLLVTLLITTY